MLFLAKAIAEGSKNLGLQQDSFVMFAARGTPHYYAAEIGHFSQIYRFVRKLDCDIFFTSAFFTYVHHVPEVSFRNKTFSSFFLLVTRDSF